MKLFKILSILLFTILIHLKAVAVECNVGGAENWYPIIEWNEDKPHGIAISRLEEFSIQNNFSFNFGPKLIWVRVLQALKSGKLDIIAGAYYTSDREQLFNYSKPFYTETIHAFYANSSPFNIKSREDLMGYYGLRPLGGSYGEEFDEFAKTHLTVEENAQVKVMFKMIVAGRADYLILAKNHGLKVIQDMQLTEQVAMSKTPIADISVHYLFNKSSHCNSLRDDLNDFLTGRINSF